MVGHIISTPMLHRKSFYDRSPPTNWTVLSTKLDVAEPGNKDTKRRPGGNSMNGEFKCKHILTLETWLDFVPLWLHVCAPALFFHRTAIQLQQKAGRIQNSLFPVGRVSPWWPLLALLSCCPTFKLSYCNLFEDRAPVGKKIYGSQSLNKLQWFHKEDGTKIVVSTMATMLHTPLWTISRMASQVHTESIQTCPRLELSGGRKSNFLSANIFHTFRIIKTHLPTEYHIHIWQVPLQLGCGDTCQIWMWFKACNLHFCNNKPVLDNEINTR